MKTKAIIFDLEGVIIDSEPIWSEIDKVFLGRRNIVYQIEKTKHLVMGHNISEVVIILQELYGFNGHIEELTKERRSIAKEIFRREIAFIHGFLDFFDKISDRYKTAIATSLEKDFLTEIDGRVNLSGLFENHIYSIEDIGFISKPNPDIFLFAARKLGIEPSDCMVIEDSPNGVKAAKRAGMHCIAITTSTTPDKLSEADMIVSSYQEVDFNDLSISFGV